MYAWYFPKDSIIHGLGHRHDWESVVVWLSNSSGNPRILAVSASEHGGFQHNTSPPVSGTHPLISYYSNVPLNHQLGYTHKHGGTQPLVAWESMPDAARVALEYTNFGKANVPFKDANYRNNLAKAF